MVDKEKIERLFSELDEYLSTLNELKELSIKDYLADKKKSIPEDIYSKYLLKLALILETILSLPKNWDCQRNTPKLSGYFLKKK